MKNIAALFIISIAIVSCGGGGSDEPSPPTPVENKAPSVPGLVAPTNGLLCVNNEVAFSWNNSVDPEGDIISYEIMISKDSQFTNVVKTEITQSLSKTYTLDKGQPYYWKVKAVDAKGKESNYTTQWSFYTEAAAGTLFNYVPFAATLIKPTINAALSGASVVFEWNASDIDNDPLTYDFYLSTSPTFTAATVLNHTIKTITRTGLQSNTIYYWRVDVKDNKGGKAIGQIWSFKTS